MHTIVVCSSIGLPTVPVPLVVVAILVVVIIVADVGLFAVAAVDIARLRVVVSVPVLFFVSIANILIAFAL